GRAQPPNSIPFIRDGREPWRVTRSTAKRLRSAASNSSADGTPSTVGLPPSAIWRSPVERGCRAAGYGRILHQAGLPQTLRPVVPASVDLRADQFAGCPYLARRKEFDLAYLQSGR